MERQFFPKYPSKHRDIIIEEIISHNNCVLSVGTTGEKPMEDYAYEKIPTKTVLITGAPQKNEPVIKIVNHVPELN